MIYTGVTVLLCDLQREQAWVSWANCVKNGVTAYSKQVRYIMFKKKLTYNNLKIR